MMFYRCSVQKILGAFLCTATAWICLTTLGTPTARGDDSTRYAAIALNDSSGGYGYAYNYDTSEEAERAAIRRAGGGSRIILTTTKAYFAFAQAPLGGWGTGAADGPDEAKAMALKNAKKNSIIPKIKFCEYNGPRY